MILENSYPAIDEVAKLITECIHYVASVRVWLTFELELAFVQKLDNSTRHCARYFNREFPPPMDKHGNQVSIPMYRNEHLISFVDLHCPTSETYKLLKQLEQHNTWRHVKARGKVVPNLYIQTVDVAKDLVVENETDAQTVQKFIRMHLRKRYTREGAVEVQETRYSNRKKSLSNIVDYIDTPECHGNLCEHIEFRLQRGQAVKTADILTIDDLIKLDPEKFWSNKFHLYDYDSRFVERLGKVATGKSRSHKLEVKDIYRDGDLVLQYETTKRAGNYILRKIWYEANEKNDYLEIQTILDFLLWYDWHSGVDLYTRNVANYLIKLDKTKLCKKKPS